MLAGLLIGGWFLGLWTGWYCIWITLAAYEEWIGESEPLFPLTDTTELIQMVVFWWLVFIAAGLLVRWFAENMEKAVQVSHGQTETLTRLLTTAAQDDDLSAFVGQTMLATAEQLHVAVAVIWVYEPDTGRLRPERLFQDNAIHTPATGRLAPLIADEVAIWQQVVAEDRPVTIDTPTTSQQQLLPAGDIRVSTHIPLHQGEQIIGLFSINRADNRPYLPTEIELAQALAQQIAFGLQLARLNTVTQQATLLGERNRMAREIHDTLAQGFTGIVIQLEAAEDMLDDDPAAAQSHLRRAQSLARDSLAEARRSVMALRPQALERHDLAGALRGLLTQLTAGTNIQTDLQVIGSMTDLPPLLEDNLLRIGQEALTNALKHAQPHHITIQLTFGPDEVRLQVKDDGCGFVVGGQDGVKPAGSGFGLIGMRERAAKIGAQLVIHSVPDKGTEILCIVPITTG